MLRTIGLDFGTTNSALAVIGEDGTPTLAQIDTGMDLRPLFRSLLYFDPDDLESRVRPRPVTGPTGIDAYLENDSSGRLIQSVKTWLASSLFSHTMIGRHRFTLEQMIAAIVVGLREIAEEQFGPLGNRAVVGRPVHLSRPASAEKDAFAIERLRKGLALAGFTEVDFEYEPVAAAYNYERRLSQDELVLIADFGGGTSDFTLMRVGPGEQNRADRQESVLGTAGVSLAGNDFDGKMVQKVVAPHLGLGSRYQTAFGKILDVPPSIYRLKWNELSVLHSPKTVQTIEEFLQGSLEPQKLEAFLYLVECDLSYALYQAIERTKVELSSKEESLFVFKDGPLQIEEVVRRSSFEAWIAPELQTISKCVDGLLESTGIEGEQVDRVFMTGGSSFIPAVRAVFADRFGADAIRTGEELTSVASGLALKRLKG